MSRVRVRRPLLALVALVVAAAIGYGVNALRSDDGTAPASPTGSRPATVSTAGAAPLSGLPAQVRDTVSLIERGGPFPYPRDDGSVFHNDEHLLPRKPDGYYHEYTVPTPGSADRGARRIVSGADGEYYYTGDHYGHFVRIARAP